MKFRGYKYTFRFNASHNTSTKTVSVHNHTFEMSLYIMSDETENDIIIYKNTEAPVEEFLSDFRDKLLNEVAPFDKILPTLENFADYAYEKLSETISARGSVLAKLEFSDSPSSIYCVSDEKPDKFTQTCIDTIAYELSEKEAVADDSTTSDNIAKDEDLADDDNENDDIITEYIPPTIIDKDKPLSLMYFFGGFLIISIVGIITTYLIVKSGYFPLGLDIHGHLFKTDVMYEGIKQGNFYPLYSEYWYNGIQPFRYWPPMPYYFMALLQFIGGGNVINAYLAFIFCSIIIGGTGWLLFARKLKRPVFGIVAGVLWFFLPDNLRVFFGEGNLPRMFITMLLPLLFYFIWQFVCYKRNGMIIPAIITMVVCIFGHLMISAMIGVLSFIFMLIYAIANKEYKKPFEIIVALLFSFAVCGIWVYPALMGGIVSMESDGNNELMASLAGKLINTLNPFIRLNNGITELYLGLSIALIAVLGLFFSNRKSVPGFLSLLIIIAGTTTALTPLIQHLPLSQLFWVRRFMPIAYCVFFISMFEWKKIKKPLLVIMCCLMFIDCIPSLDLAQYDSKMNLPATVKDIPQSLADTQIDVAKELTKSRSSIMDISMYGPMPSYAYGTLEKKTPYVFGWAWQGAATAENIVNINEAYERENFEFMFDRNLELGADTVIVDKRLFKTVYTKDKVLASAEKVGYNLVSETDISMLFQYDVDGTFGTITDYKSIAIGSNANLVQLILPSYRTGDKLNIDEYTVDELSKYDNIYLSGFFYNSKKSAEKLVTDLAEKGCNVYVDMNHIPPDPVTNRMTFLDVSAQPVVFVEKFPDLITKDRICSPKNFEEEYYNWNTVYITGVKESLGSVWFKDTKLDFAGKTDSDNITFIGLNILFHAYTAEDADVYDLLANLINADTEELPQRQLVPLEINYDTNRITITSEYDNVNTTLAFQDTFSSQQNIKSDMNLLVVDKGTTVIEMHYPYFKQGVVVSIAGIVIEIILLLFVFRKKKHRPFFEHYKF